MSDPMRPADVVRAVTAGVSRLIAGGLDDVAVEAELDALAALYAEETDVRHPFAPLGDEPLRTRAQLRAHFAGGPGRAGAESFAPVGVRVHETTDPEVVVMEFRYEGVAHGRPFSVPCVFVVRVRNGMIVESRDYADHVGFARASGQLGGLAAALAASVDGAGRSTGVGV
jgi:ketosteroid isomerase-like protein